MGCYWYEEWHTGSYAAHVYRYQIYIVQTHIPWKIHGLCVITQCPNRSISHISVFVVWLRGLVLHGFRCFRWSPTLMALPIRRVNTTRWMMAVRKRHRLIRRISFWSQQMLDTNSMWKRGCLHLLMVAKRCQRCLRRLVGLICKQSGTDWVIIYVPSSLYTLPK